MSTTIETLSFYKEKYFKICLFYLADSLISIIKQGKTEFSYLYYNTIYLYNILFIYVSALILAYCLLFESS